MVILLPPAAHSWNNGMYFLCNTGCSTQSGNFLFEGRKGTNFKLTSHILMSCQFEYHACICYLKFKEEMDLLWIFFIMMATYSWIEWIYREKYFKAHILKAQLWFCLHKIKTGKFEFYLLTDELRKCHTYLGVSNCSLLLRKNISLPI